MTEIRIPVTRFDLRNQAALVSQGERFERRHVERSILPHGVYVHIGKRCCQILHSSESLIEQFAASQTVHVSVRNDIAGPIVQSVAFQQLRLESPVLHNLRRKFDEIAFDAAESAIRNILEEVVQGMAELVEKRFGLIDGQKRRRRTGRPREVAYD